MLVVVLGIQGVLEVTLPMDKGNYYIKPLCHKTNMVINEISSYGCKEKAKNLSLKKPIASALYYKNNKNLLRVIHYKIKFHEYISFM